MGDNLQRYRALTKYLPKDSQNRLVVITGARQTGKTTLAKYTYPNLSYFNLDAIENRLSIREIGSASWGKDVGNAILDEAQKEPQTFEKVKYAYDSAQISFSVLLGSAQILLLHNVRESLSGRAFIYELWPLMVSEFLSSSPADIPASPMLDEILEAQSISVLLNSKPSSLFSEEESIKRRAENYILKWGGMPALLHLDDADKKQWLKSYEYTYLERDLADLAKLKDLEPFRKFQKLTALRSAKLLNYSELARDAGISVDSARRYLEYLKLSYQAILLQPYYENLTSSAIKSPKIYLTDVGILRQISGFMGEATGEIFETYAVSEVFKWIKTNQKNIELYFYRTRSGLELDLLLKTEKGFIGVEIKSGQRISRTDYQPMLSLSQKLPNRWIGGICIYRGNKIEKLADPNIWAIPSYRLFT